MRRSADPALPVADNLLRQGKLGGGLGPALLFIIEVRRVSPVMLKQTVYCRYKRRNCTSRQSNWRLSARAQRFTSACRLVSSYKVRAMPSCLSCVFRAGVK